MNKYANDFVYGRDRLIKLLVATGIGCVLVFFTPEKSMAQILAMCFTVVSFATSWAVIFKYCRCPNCGKVIFLGVVNAKICPRCNRDLVSGKKVKKSKR